jgi:hypothetical protein
LLLESEDHCGRCDHSCGGAGCAGGRCNPREEASVRGGCELNLLGALGDDVYYTACQTLLGAIGRTLPVADLSDERADAGFTDLTVSGVAGSRTDLYFKASTRLFHVGGDGVLQELARNLPGDYNTRFTGTDQLLAYPTPTQLILLDKTGAVRKPIDSASPADIVSSDNVLYWMEETWNPLAHGQDGPNPQTRIKKTSDGSNVAIVRDEAARLTALTAADDGLYYAKLGAGGGIYRLPPKADITTTSELIAPDDGLSEKVAIAIDQTHVYWMRPLGTNGDAEIVKRAKCGGATVTVLSPLPRLMLSPTGLAVANGRLYYADQPAVRSVAP